ncbi:hypothetical protein [Duganella sp. LjRoot269]|uniref:hypothetical protein n=1 Tax=Duganella sp. LjRoot269 TaxID=3342305 RepID=UPI003ECD8190
MPTTSDEWQLFLLTFFQFYLTDTRWSKTSAKSRMKCWTGVVKVTFGFWVDEESIPCDVIIPSIRLKPVASDITGHRLVGAKAPSVTAIQRVPQKTLVDIGFGLSEGDFLERVELECRDKIGAIQRTCLAHWAALTQDACAGNSLAVTSEQIIAVDKSGVFLEQIAPYGSKTPLASPSHPHGHRWAFGVAKELLSYGRDKNCVSLQNLSASLFFTKKPFVNEGYGMLQSLTAMPIDAFKKLTTHGQFCRFLGLMSSLDASVACCLLTIEHPQFNPESLQNAKLLNARGKPYLLLTDDESSSVFSVDKPRAGTRKTAALSPLAQKLVIEIISLTAPVRAVLRRAGDKAWRYLFLGSGKGGRLCPLNPKARNLNSTSYSTSLVGLYPTLIEHGLMSGNFDFRRIRTTMGVLKWFETGSIQSMSARLGNTKRVVLEHYLPPSLLRAWNTRIIRRFQNTLIILAAFEEEYLLELTDFSSNTDLQHFIEQIVLEYPSSTSPLAVEVQRRLGGGADEDKLDLQDSILNLRLSPVSLCYLYAYADYSVATLDAVALEKVDVSTKLAPIHFVVLCRMIRHACENDDIAGDLRELLDIAALKQVHKEATLRLPTVASRFAKMSLDVHWSDVNG